MQEAQKSLIRQVLQNEAAQIVGIILAIAGFYNQVILPIREIQLDLAQVKLDLVQIKDTQKQVVGNTNDISVLQEQIKQLQGRN